MFPETAYPNVVGAFFDTKWAIMPEAMPKLVGVVNRWALGVQLDKSAIQEIMAGRPQKLQRAEGQVGILPLYGIVSQRLNIMQVISEGGTSTEMFGKAFDKMMADPEVGAIVLDVDSPGGSVYGVQELAEKIHAARGGGKQIIAVANSLAASAAYWIATAADKFYVTPSGEAGSIGVLALHVDQSGLNSQIGIVPTYVHAGRYKVEGNPHSPLDSEALAAIQGAVDGYYDSFTDAVARHRGVKQSAVKSGFGEGRVVAAAKAVEAGMADGVRTLESVVAELTRGRQPKQGRGAADVKRRLEVMEKIHG